MGCNETTVCGHPIRRCNFELHVYVNVCANLFQPVDIEAVAERLLGNTTYVGWPHLFEAKVVQVSNDTDR